MRNGNSPSTLPLAVATTNDSPTAPLASVAINIAQTSTSRHQGDRSQPACPDPRRNVYLLTHRRKAVHERNGYRSTIT